MNSYFEIMLNLMCMMMIATLFAVPLMLKFSTFSALSSQPGLQIYSIGNMGGASTIC